ncbi:MAG: hypothetical protein V3V14_09610 [Saprospiraceae bacterium]
MKNIIVVFLLLGYCGLFGQGNVSITNSSNIDQMLSKFISKHKANETIKAWRIQIITTDDRRKMEHAKSKFANLYPGIDIKWNHVAPYYRVRVGAYENKMQLMGFLIELKNEFRGVIPVMDNINKSELVGY